MHNVLDLSIEFQFILGITLLGIPDRDLLFDWKPEDGQISISGADFIGSPLIRDTPAVFFRQDRSLPSIFVWMCVEPDFFFTAGGHTDVGC